MSTPVRLPRPLLLLVLLHSLASLAHFSHNAEYIALYPNMPAWLGREDVYLAWLGVSAVGAASGLLWVLGWRLAAVAGLGIYGAMGLDGLFHYTLALCSEHSFVMNLTIWGEAATGAVLALAALRYLVANRRPSPAF